MYNVLAIGACGAVGVLLRWALLKWMPSSGFPWVVLVVNILGSFAAGYFYANKLFHERSDFFSEQAILIGLLGGFTTFSAFSLDTVRLAQESSLHLALLNVVLNNVLGLGACYLGVRIATIV